MPEPLRNNVQWSWPTAPVSTPTTEDETPVSVDYTRPVDTSQPADIGSNISTVNDIVEEPIDGRSAAIQASQEERRLRNIQ